MKRLSPKLGVTEGGTYFFFCPGCDSPIGIKGWKFDGNVEAPTFSPSILSDRGKGDRCHSFIRGGKIQYLEDCTHQYAGQTIELPDIPAWVFGEDEE